MGATVPQRKALVLKASRILLSEKPLPERLQAFLEALLEGPFPIRSGKLYLRKGEGLRLVAQLGGEAGGEEVALSLEGGGRALGRLSLRLAPAASLAPEDRLALEEAAGILALALLRERAERAERVLRRAGECATQAAGEGDLLHKVCALLVEEGYALAWVGEARPTGEVVPREAAGAVGYLEGIRVRWDEAPEGQGPTGRALRSGRPQVLRSVEEDPRYAPWRERAQVFGFASSAAFPLRVEGRVWGSLNVYAPEEDAFDEEEVRLLEDLARLIGHALDRLRALERLRFLAYHDPLTGLPNRRRLEEDFRLLRGRWALCRLDLVDLYEVNEAYGREAGDALLARTSRRLQALLPREGRLYRLEGGEFLALLPGGAKEAEAVGQALGEALEAPLDLGEGRAFRVRVRAGVALFPDDANTLSELLRRADQALREAKKAGKRWTFYSLGLGEAVRERREVLAGLEKALAEGELRLYGQPIVDLATGRPAGVEVLLRWARGEEVVPASRFIPVAEEAGLIPELDLYVLRALAQMTTALPLHVNLSPQTLLDERLLLGLAPLKGRNLRLELTEHALASPGAEARLKELSCMGFPVVLDDFGQGYASLRLLVGLPFSMAKVDRGFVGGIGLDPKAEAALKAVLALSRELEIALVAEGVEREDQWAWLRSVGYSLGQGYLWGRPAPLEEVLYP